MQRFIGLFLALSVLLASCGGAAITYDASQPITSFNQLREQLAKTDDQAAQLKLINDFNALFPASPLTQGDQALFMVEKDAPRMELSSDLTNWFQTIPMQRLGTTNWWGVVQTISPTARIDYRFGVGGGGGLINDPRNSTVVPSSMGLNSELRMPEYVTPTEIISRSDVPKGTLEELGDYYTEISKTTHQLHVYLPPNYDPAKQYPSVYFQDGDDYQNYAFTPTILDNAIADQILPPLIAVFVKPSREQGRQRDYDLNDAYSEFFATELVPMIDSKYSTINDPKQRVVVGDSYGGLISLYLALQYPEVFGAVVNQSGFVSRQNGRLLTLMSIQPPVNARIVTVVGTYETCIGGPVTGDECNFLEGNRTLRDILVGAGVELNYAEYPQGHAWAFWRDHIDREVAWALDWQKP
ncbi:alpha/beta hydrolase [Herpetosiphon giganteus]|uniref:alpha/beta hydrolase n=1 Tax=Herpetosiphon giganteus TaxID=2029754 RepID=UPI001958944A|nr:alpha/beta hydrolase-fold protein [Herpetosiphon giganteus]MBM7846312.1 enterochelin esterase family protein [Herpetosiphon giganteus]